MYGNGVAIGMAVIHRHHKRILRDPRQGLTVCSVGAAGTTEHGTVVWLFASAIARTPATTATASASLYALSLN